MKIHEHAASIAIRSDILVNAKRSAPPWPLGGRKPRTGRHARQGRVGVTLEQALDDGAEQ